jgi:hypothetical protein
MNATHLLRLHARRRLNWLHHLDALESQKEQLLELVRHARNTTFGREHGFDDMDSVAAFQTCVPLQNHETLWRDYWSKSYPVLEDCTWPGRMPFFALTSGTTSASSKAIPVSHEMVRANRRAALDVLCWHMVHHPTSRLLAGKTLMLGGSTALETLAPGVQAGDLSGIAAVTAPFWSRLYLLPPRHIALLGDWDRKLTALAQLAIHERITVLSGTPSWMLPLFERVIALRGGMGPAFPDLQLLIHGGVSFELYRDRILGYLQDTPAQTREVYPASEGFIAMADGSPEEGLRLMVDNGLFYEFVPAEDLCDGMPVPQSRRRWLADVSCGVNYALALSSNAGVWACLIGDTVRFVNLHPPRLVITGRVQAMLSACGEHLTVAELEHAMTLASHNLGWVVTDFTVGTLFRPSGLAQHGYLVAMPDQASKRPCLHAPLAASIDEILQQGNDDYRAHRQSDAQLLAPLVVLVSEAAVEHWMRATGHLGGQNKLPRVLNDTRRFAALAQALDAWALLQGLQE